MRRIRWCYLLPICNAAIDLILIGILITQHRSYDQYRRSVYAESLERLLDRRMPHAPGLKPKESRPADLSGPPSQPYYAAIIGTAPAGILSAEVISVPLRDMLGRPLDVKWFFVHETLAFAFWFAAGMLAEPASRKWRLFLIAFMVLRLLSAVLSAQAGDTFSRSFAVCSATLGAAWAVAAVCLLRNGTRWLLAPFRAMFG